MSSEAVRDGGMDKHITLVGVLHIVWHAMALLVALFASTVVALVLRTAAAEPEALRIGSVLMRVVVGIVVALAIPGIIGGIALLRRQRWGRIVVMVVSIFDLIDIPFGTALGVYSLWVLLHDGTIASFEGRGGS